MWPKNKKKECLADVPLLKPNSTSLLLQPSLQQLFSLPCSSWSKIAFYFTKQGKRWTWRLRERCSKKPLVGWLVSKQMEDRWGKVGGLGSLCPRTLTELRLDCFALNRPRTSLFPQNKRVVVNTYPHCQRSGKALELSREQYIKCFYTSSFGKNKNLLRSACVIHQQVSLVVYRRNKLARTWKLPELPSQKSPVSPDGGLVYWTGKGKKQAKHNSSLFTHICTHLDWCTSTCTHKNTHRKPLGACTQHMQRANPLHRWLFSETRALTNTAASLNWHRDLAWEHRWCSNAAGKKVLGFKIINISVRKIVS